MRVGIREGDAAEKGKAQPINQKLTWRHWTWQPHRRPSRAASGSVVRVRIGEDHPRKCEREGKGRPGEAPRSGKWRAHVKVVAHGLDRGPQLLLDIRKELKKKEREQGGGFKEGSRGERSPPFQRHKQPAPAVRSARSRSPPRRASLRRCSSSRGMGTGGTTPARGYTHDTITKGAGSNKSRRLASSAHIPLTLSDSPSPCRLQRGKYRGPPRRPARPSQRGGCSRQVARGA